MKIDDSRKKPVFGDPLSSFALGDCVRLVRSDDGDPCGGVYIITTGPEGTRAVNLHSGQHRNTGSFWLELNAKVVIE